MWAKAHGFLNRFFSGSCSETEVSEQLYYKNWIKEIKNITFIEKYDGYFSGVYSRSMDTFFGVDPTMNRGDPITVKSLGSKSVYIG
jgi:hypothetical protein